MRRPELPVFPLTLSRKRAAQAGERKSRNLINWNQIFENVREKHEVRDRVVPQDPRSQGLKVASRYSSNNSDHKLQGQSPKVASRYNSNSSDAGPPNKPSLHEMEACLLNNCCFDDLPDVDVFGLLGHHSAKKLVQESQVIRDYFNYNLKVTRGDMQEMKGHTIVEGDAVLRELFEDFRYVTPPATAENETAEGVTL